jgi:hypothetical protein
MGTGPESTAVKLKRTRREERKNAVYALVNEDLTATSNAVIFNLTE